LNAALRRSAERCGLAGQVGSHRLRHTFSMHSLQVGMDVVALSRLMGHRCIQSTMRYVTPDPWPIRCCSILYVYSPIFMHRRHSYRHPRVPLDAHAMKNTTC
jgi:integrase